MKNNERIMVDFSLTEPILPLLDARFSKESEIVVVYRKVRGVLENFAEHKGHNPNRLRILEVYNQRGEIAIKLNRFIDAIPRSEKQSVQRWKNYKSEIRANLRRVSRELFDLSAGGPEKEFHSSVLDLVPDEMRAVVEHLPKERAWTCVKREERGRLAISERGLLILSAMMNVWRRLNLSTLRELFENSASIRHEILAIGPRRLAISALGQLYRTRDKLGFERHPLKKTDCIDVKDWPQPLRGEWENFELLAKHGVGANHRLRLSAKKLKFSIKKLSATTVTNYKTAFGYALSVIRPTGDLSILDLIKVTPREGAADDDDLPTEHNSIVDIYRSSEQQKKGTVKNPGFDSGMFARFAHGVMSVAARNGYGRYIRAFRQAYRIFLDEDAKLSRRAMKKAGIPIEWVDKEILRLYPEFLRVVNTGSFKIAPGRIRDACGDAFFVLFFVWCTVLRYMGYRQQSPRGCIVGVNFILRPDRTIVLHFDETKNHKRIHMELTEDSPDTHVLLWNVLYLYYRKVYPYLVRQSGDTLGGKLFVTTSMKNFFRPFKNGKDFYEVFKRGGDKFLRTSELEPQVRHMLNPHFLRGMCADWMILILHMSFEEAGEVLGDDPKTLERDYVDKNRVHDGGAVLKEVERRRKMIQSEMGASARIEGLVERIEKSYKDVLAQKDREIDALRQKNEEALALITELTAGL